MAARRVFFARPNDRAPSTGHVDSPRHRLFIHRKVMKKRILTGYRRIFPHCRRKKDHGLPRSDTLSAIMARGIVSVSLDSGQFRHYTEAMRPAESEVLHHFDTRRRDFAPYGFTCEVWEPRQMLRPDRHDEIEINFLDR